MRSNTPQTLNPIESVVWGLYQQQRNDELSQMNPGMSENDRENLSWYEFLQLKWSLSGSTEADSVSRFDLALRTHNFGPDLRTAPRHILKIAKSVKIKKVKNHTIKSHLKGARDGHKPGILHNSSYTYYVHKRMNELKQQGEQICVKSTVPMIAKEWSSLTDQQRMAFDNEWKSYCNDLKTKNDNPINQN